ncbi:MAG: hypothetical protein CMJ78_06655 [Planctomycetaceae bacterium]|nr:hypothetical protein [Planctomycetaceae bacterium]
MSEIYDEILKRERKRSVLALLAMIVVLPFALWAAQGIHLENNVANWLPKDDPLSVTLKWYHRQFSHEDRIIVSWDSSSLRDRRVESFVAELKNTANKGELGELFSSVRSPNEAIKFMADFKVDRDEAVQRLRGIMFSTGKNHVYVELGKDARSQIDTAIERLIGAAATDLSLNIRVARDKYSKTDEGETIGLRVEWDGLNPDDERFAQFRQLSLSMPLDLSDDEDDPDPLFTNCELDGPVVIPITYSEAAIENLKVSYQALQDAAVAANIDPNEFRLGGSPIVRSSLNRAVKGAGWNRDYPVWQLNKRSPVLLSLIVGLFLSFVMLRSGRLATLVLMIALYTTFVTLSLVPVTKGSMNMVLVVMPNLLLVLTISGGIHVANYWKHAAAHDLKTAVREAVRMAKEPCALASVTTAIGLISLMTSPLKPVRDFGMYSAIGCVGAIFTILVGLPALLLFWPSKAFAVSETSPKVWDRLGSFLTRRWLLVSSGCLTAFAISLVGLKDFRTETKVIRYFPNTSKLIQDYYFLEDNLSGIVPVETVVRFGPEAQEKLNILQRLELVRELERRIGEYQDITGTISLADFRPVSNELAENATRIQRALYNKRVNETQKALRGEKASAVKRLLAVSTESLDTPDGRELSRPGDELWRITAQVLVMTDMDYTVLTDDVDRIATEVLGPSGANHVVTGTIPLFLRTQKAVLESLIRSFGLAFCIIAVVMMVLLRNPLAGLIAMLPNLMPVGVVFGLIAWNGLAIDIGSMITASVALGIAIDGTLHLLTWFKEGVGRGLSRDEAVSAALAHCGPAMWQTSAIVGIGLMMLSGCDLLLVSRFGLIMAALIGAALVADIIFLPALLAGPLGRLIERSVQAQKAKEPSAATTEVAAEAVS